MHNNSSIPRYLHQLSDEAVGEVKRTAVRLSDIPIDVLENVPDDRIYFITPPCIENIEMKPDGKIEVTVDYSGSEVLILTSIGIMPK